MKNLYIITLFICLGLSSAAQITSVANGNFYFPTTWSCTCVPTSGTDDLIINHNVTLNNDLQLLATGSITINNGGSLLQDLTPRDFFLNGGDFTNNGNFTVDRMLAQNGTFTNTGTSQIRTFANYLTFDNSGTINNVDSLYNDGYLTNNGTINVGTFYNNNIMDNYGSLPAVDSLTNAGVLTNFPGAYIDADSMLNTATLDNNGIIATIALYSSGDLTNNDYIGFYWLTNAGTFNNNDSMVGTYFWNNEDFFNNTSGVMTLAGDFYNGDTLNFDAAFVNNGAVEGAQGWYNTDDVSGTAPGYFIIQDSTANVGTMTGSYDFCDLSQTAIVAPFIDFNSGTVDANITYCVLVSAEETTSLEFSVYPNPSSSIITVSGLTSGEVDIYDVTGRVVYSAALAQKTSIDVSSLPAGTYLLRMVQDNNITSRPLVIVK